MKYFQLKIAFKVSLNSEAGKKTAANWSSFHHTADTRFHPTADTSVNKQWSFCSHPTLYLWRLHQGSSSLGTIKLPYSPIIVHTNIFKNPWFSSEKYSGTTICIVFAVKGSYTIFTKFQNTYHFEKNSWLLGCRNPAAWICKSILKKIMEHLLPRQDKLNLPFLLVTSQHWWHFPHNIK